MTNQPTSRSAADKPGLIRAWLLRLLFPCEAADLRTLRVQLEELRKDLGFEQERSDRLSSSLAREHADHIAVLKRLEKEFDRLTTVHEKAVAEDRRIPAEQLDADELAAAFDIDADEDLWRAVHQVLDVAIQEAIEESSQSPAGGKFTADDRGFASGGVDFLRDFQGALIAHRAKARTKAAQAAAEKEA
jgi:hypothetical protein